MKIKYIKYNEDYKGLFLNNIYNVYTTNNWRYCIIDDVGNKFWYDKKYFEIIKEKDKICLLCGKDYELVCGNMTYHNWTFSKYQKVQIYYNNVPILDLVYSGEGLKTLEEANEVLAHYNVKLIKEEEVPKKYKILEKEYSQQEMEELSKIGVKFKEIKN